MKRPASFLIALAAVLVAALWFWFRGADQPLKRETVAYREERVRPVTQAAPLPPAPSPSEVTAPTEPVPQPATEEVDPFGPPRLFRRPPDEWQGMLMDLNVSPPCEEPAGCGMARACKDGRCGPCEADSDCASGEGCVLDHCLKRSNIACHRKVECGDGSSCVLSGYSNGTRGNEDMRAYCLKLASGAGRLPPREKPAITDRRDHLPDDDLLNAAREARRH